MEQKTGNKGKTMNLLFTMLLFLIFVLCALFTVLIGGKVYENISERMEENYTGSVAVSYIANKVRQGDTSGCVAVREVEGIQVLELEQKFDEETYVTQIYYRDGSICELFSEKDSGLMLEFGLPIIECDGLQLSQEGNLLTIQTTGKGSSKLKLALRSGGLEYGCE